ncbi:host cell division inhibitor Icd-like protein [Yersinia pseudotuberculosis]|uniref:Host cell division inhibitor Icd-like protein n=2 Tax=Yersinia pseudotuberculosis TaxID=633 RepID=A0A380Q5T7_YERPU|nr:hypothetical protein DJ40_1933 [Yersinia pseudotuberculosis]SUP80637.1 Uncharacterised protein [Yersinia pseudotuberculosis]
MILTTQAASQNKAFPLAGILNRLPLSESHIKHRNSPSSPVGRNPLIKLNCAEMEELANSLIRFNSDEVPESGNSLILSKTSVRGSREIQDEQQPSSPEHYRYLGSAVIRNGCNNENQQVTGKEKGSAENTTLEMVPFLLHEENQRSPALDYKIKHDPSNLRNEVNQHIAEQHVRTCETFVGHRVTVSKPIQPFGSMPSRSKRWRQESLTHELNCPLSAAFSICSNNSSSKRIIFLVLPERSVLFFEFLSCIGSYRYVRLELDGMNHFIGDYHKKQRPGVFAALPRRLTTNDRLNIEAAMLNHTPTRFKFLFLAVCRSDLNSKPHRESVTAHSEQDARRSLAGQFVLSFAGRLPKVNHG